MIEKSHYKTTQNVYGSNYHI